MKLRVPKLSLSHGVDAVRRRLMGAALVTGTGLAAVGTARAEEAGGDELVFPGDEPAHKLVYQFNQADPDYMEHVLFSVGALLRKYGDNIKLVVSAFGPGIHILAKNPGRPVPEEIRQRVASLAQYGVAFHACNNTLLSLKWTADDLLPFAKVVDAGAADIMELQEQGYAYISW